MAPATHQPAPSDTQGNASRQLAVVVVFGRRVVPALWRLTFETPISWMSLNVGGSELAVGAVPQATCRACDLAAVISDKSWRVYQSPKSPEDHVDDTAPASQICDFGQRLRHNCSKRSALVCLDAVTT